MMPGSTRRLSGTAGRASEALDSLDDQLLELCRVGALGDWVPCLHRSAQIAQPWEEAARLYHPDDRERLRSLPYHGRLEAILSLRAHLPPPAYLVHNLSHYAKQQSQRVAHEKSRGEEVAIRKELRAAKVVTEAPGIGLDSFLTDSRRSSKGLST